jgi:hypothetical protein
MNAFSFVIVFAAGFPWLPWLDGVKKHDPTVANAGAAQGRFASGQRPESDPALRGVSIYGRRAPYIANGATAHSIAGDHAEQSQKDANDLQFGADHWHLYTPHYPPADYTSGHDSAAGSNGQVLLL